MHESIELVFDGSHHNGVKSAKRSIIGIANDPPEGVVDFHCNLLYSHKLH